MSSETVNIEVHQPSHTLLGETDQSLTTKNQDNSSRKVNYVIPYEVINSTDSDQEEDELNESESQQNLNIIGQVGELQEQEDPDDGDDESTES